MSLSFIAFVTILHVVGKVRGCTGVGDTGQGPGVVCSCWSTAGR